MPTTGAEPPPASDPVLIDVPERIETERLVLRSARPGDGAALNAAVCASIVALRPWMQWAQIAPTLDDSEAYCRRQHAKFLLREELLMLMFEQGVEGADSPVLGAIDLHHIDWVARTFELGYWRRAGLDGLGVVGEAVAALTQLAFDRLGARRVEIRMGDDNLRSCRVAERAGFELEGVLRLDSTSPAGTPRSTRVYARVRSPEAIGSVQA